MVIGFTKGALLATHFHTLFGKQRLDRLVFMTTLADIAKRAGVTPAVVSRIVNGDGSLRVSKETRSRVEKLITELGYAPNVAAQSLKSARSGTLAFILHDIVNPVYGRILRGAQAEAANRSLAILLGDAAVAPVSNDRLAQLIAGGGVDGVILQSAGEVSDEIILRAARKDTPIVLLQHALDINASLIRLPDTAAAEMATMHLRELGHRRIGCLATLQGLSLTEARLAGWHSSLADGATSDAIIYAPSHSAGGEAAAAELLRSRPDLTALVCFNVVAAVGALRTARSLGRLVPGDLSVIAIHDAPFAGDLAVPLTVIDMPLEEMGRRAVSAVFEPEPVQEVIKSPPRLIQRASTASPRNR
ncbi:LacI family DNA-binding transcriptional regulator [Boseongicola sp. H5]|uniref:LacI family DNA-binding transcriptional regulator n=1 Tax=Boseongicola sp. H5 TaxID=2763261 RepID=UPI00336A5E34